MSGVDKIEITKSPHSLKTLLAQKKRFSPYTTYAQALIVLSLNFSARS